MPRVRILSFSCSFRDKFGQLIDWRRHLGSWRPSPSGKSWNRQWKCSFVPSRQAQHELKLRHEMLSHLVHLSFTCNHYISPGMDILLNKLRQQSTDQANEIDKMKVTLEEQIRKETNEMRANISSKTSSHQHTCFYVNIFSKYSYTLSLLCFLSTETFKQSQSDKS